MRALIQELEVADQDLAMPMPAMPLKQRHFAVSNLARSRTAQGAAIKRT
jgi:hypothetical protein